MRLRVKAMCCAMFMLAAALWINNWPMVQAAVIEDEDTAPAKPVKVEKKVKAAKKIKPVKKAVEEEATVEEVATPADTTEAASAEPGVKKSMTKKAGTFPFYVYKDKGPGNHYIPSGWMGDYGDMKISANWTDNPHSPTTCLKITYNAKGANGAGWAGIYWQQPANNWGTVNAGYDLTGAKKLTFWARGEKGTEVINEFKIGGIQGEYADTDVAGIGPVKLTTTWKQYTIDLAGKDLSRIAGGFCWATSADENPDGFVMYFDDIGYE
ncbi:MAG: hypothetical protein HY920_02470 [Elusimicrobia bacterium]|nr:hypothetical protein [Elusimicrobiota bacterium]